MRGGAINNNVNYFSLGIEVEGKMLVNFQKPLELGSARSRGIGGALKGRTEGKGKTSRKFWGTSTMAGAPWNRLCTPLALVRD
jgi:hypothetical protein